MSDRFEVTTLDITIIVVYLIASRIIPLVLAPKPREGQDASESYFLGGKNFVWPLVGLSLVATNMSGATYVGLAGAGYSQGISVYAYEWMTTVILVVFIFFLLPFYIKSGVFTLPEFLDKRFDRRSRLTFAGFNLFANMFIDMAAALYAGGLVVQAIFPAIPLWVSIAVLATLAAIYTVVGGLGAVMISDGIQATLTLIGGGVVFFLALNAIPSWDAVTQAAGEERMSLILPVGNEALPWPGLITGVFIIGLYYWTTNQLVVQRTLGARSLDHGRWGSILAGFVKLSFLFLFILPGTFAIILYPNLENPDLVFPTLVFDLLPIGVRGLILAAVIAAITSTVDSILNSASTIVTMDFVRTFRPDTTQRGLVFIGRVSTIGALIVAVVWAPTIAQFDTLYQYLQSILSYVVPPIVATFLLGIMWTRINANAAFYTLVILIPLGVVMFIVNEVFGTFTIQFLYVAGISFAVSLTMLTVISLLGYRPDPEKTEDLTWKPQYWREETRELQGKPLWQNFRFLSIVMLVSTIVIVYIFR
ncbi:sss: transporter, solute:sodium symporter (SSS) family [Rubrobacter radiotolerans]|uniref:Sodium:solute symporter n=1 Tax=Rubrobacter radiotolerans TaxID=42256 RepID=A0A023X6H8_RUBRA|nr:sodium:solute symporter [Rubrobacter radiotolerans]AHY47590.1 sss: transporter, solute:sodium symporter (SSS) family [Rubrobacter radiotolerans]MDX5894995.1 sodium:solute symporter [Rubrobacter radiotolerans]SMC07235.1 solute:Na+ symporter, SSS family [Rubrobacter radiotolerans DSM 5868]